MIYEADSRPWSIIAGSACIILLGYNSKILEKILPPPNPGFGSGCPLWCTLLTYTVFIPGKIIFNKKSPGRFLDLKYQYPKTQFKSILEAINKFYRENLKMPEQNKLQMTLQNALCTADIESDCRTTSGVV